MICPGIVAECEPGSAGCDDRGETYTCSACGQMEPSGEQCARLLASDKEVGLFCVVRGERDLVCGGTPVEFRDDLVFPMELDHVVRQLRLPDDATSFADPTTHCFIDDDGSVGCTAPELVPVGTAPCSDVSITDGHVVCTVCNGELQCPNRDLVVDDVKAVIGSDAMPFWLDDAGEIHWPITEEPFVSGTYVSFFMDDNQVPCGIEADGDFGCAPDAAGGAAIEVAGPFVRGTAAGLHYLCAITPQGTIDCFQLEDGAKAPRYSPPGDGFTQIASSQLRFCALDALGSVTCWDHVGLLEDLSQQLN